MSIKSQWQKIWKRQYNNQSDSRWKIKSLNPEPVQQYPIKLPKTEISTQIAILDNKQSKKDKVEATKPKEEMLPAPKMSKINDTVFCISIEREIHIFYLIKNPDEKAKMKIKKTFGVIPHCISHKILQVVGNNSQLIFVATKNELIVLELIDTKNNGIKDCIKTKCSIKIPQITALLTVEKKLIVFSSTNIYQYNVTDKLEEACVKKIDFDNLQDQKIYRQLQPVGIVIGCNQSFYFFGSKVQEQIDLSKFKGDPGEQQKKNMCQFLTIVKLSVKGSNQIEGVRAKLFPIDHIFQLGIFTRSKIYEIQRQTFLVSLHQQIILVKKNYDRYIVWDNVSVVSSKSQSKKGQLILADQSILVYSQNIQIFAHEIFYNSLQSKLSMPPIDNFKGNDNDEQILYDAIVLRDVDSVIKVLTYIRPSTVIYPSNESNIKKKQTDPNKVKDEQQQLEFTIICISQSDPKKKLQQLIKKGKPNSQIQIFCKRFSIDYQDEIKSRWNVSQKKLKDIENILMCIRSDKFIQQELDDILKSSSHSLAFLIAVQTKQISRLKQLLVDKICSLEEANDPSQAERYIELCLQWLMQSQMFLKKLNYSKNFLSFKEYDFIEIGKLKASSLKEEIKLLSCKKFEKRLKYYLNSFKTLVISNYDDVFKFLLIGKSLSEIKEFLISFRFILPEFKQTSEVFIMKKNYQIHAKNMVTTPNYTNSLSPQGKRQRSLSFAANQSEDLFIKTFIQKNAKEKTGQKRQAVEKHEKQKDQKCILWEPFDESQKIIQTIQYFEEQTFNEIRAASKTEIGKQRASRKFKEILDGFIKKTWFATAAFKQHSMIPKKTSEIHQEFKQLKSKRAFEILINFLYQIIAKGHEESQKQINQMLTTEQFKKMIPQSFKKNVDARVRVYREVLSKKTVKEGKINVYLKLPLLQDFIVLSQYQYFESLFQNIRSQILTDVKIIYDDIQPQFFRERFKIYLQSDKLKPADIISFCDEFASVKQGCDDIRLDVFHTIIRLLRLSDKQNTQHYLIKSLNTEVLPEQDDNNTGKLRQQAKIPFGFYYYNFFKAFKIDYSYEQLIKFTNSSSIKDNLIIQELVRKYCKGEYIKNQYQGQEICQISFEESKTVHQNLPTINIHKQPLQFFGLIMHMLDSLDFEITEKEVFDLILENYLNEGKFSELSEFIRKLKNYHVNESNLKSNNYLMIKDFKEQFEIDQNDKPIISYILSWIKRIYDSIADKETLQSKLNAVNSAIEMLTNLNKHSSQVKKERDLFTLLIQIKKFEAGMILNVQKLKRQAFKQNSFIFMMHRIKQMGVQRFREFSSKNMEIEVISNLSYMFVSHKKYALDQIVDPYHKDFIRFLIELCIIMIEQNIYSFAKYLITKRIPNDNYYFKDIIFLFISSIRVRQGQQKQLASNVAKHILLPQTTSLIRQNLEQKIIDAFNVYEFIPINLLKKEQIQNKDKKPEIQASKTNDYSARCKLMFQWIMQRNRKDDAYFFLVRAKVLSNDEIIEYANLNRRGYGDNHQQNMLKIEQAAYFLVVIYMKALQLFIQRQFYPTFTFFQSKMTLLLDLKERKDIIKDINIAISKLEKRKTESDKKKLLQSIKQQLQKYYIKFMSAIGQNPDIDLVQSDSREIQATKRVQINSRKMPRVDILQEENNKEIQYKKQLQRNLQKINNKQEQNRINVMQKEITQRITQIKKANQRFNMETERKQENNETNLVAKKQRQLQEIKRKEKQDIQSIKDTYKSDTSKRVNMIIQTLKRNREEAGSKMNRQGPSNIPMNNKPIFSQPPNMRNRNEMIAGMQSPKTDKLTQNILPFTMKTKLQRIQNIREEIKNQGPDNRLIQLQKKMFSDKQTLDKPTSFKKVINFDQILKLYRQRQSQQAVKCIQKYDIVKDNHIRGQVIRRAYSVTNNLENFLQFLKYLVNSDKTWKLAIEQKSIQITQQMIKMQTKEKLNIKEIIPPTFFTLVTNVSLKDFYNHAFENIFKPSIKKIFEKDLMPVHAVGILFRYTLGSQNKFYNKVFHEYFKVLFKNFDLKGVDDKEMILFAQKIRSNYVNLPESKENILEQLFNTLTNPTKKARLLQALKKTLQRKGQSLVGGSSNKQISMLLQKLMK